MPSVRTVVRSIGIAWRRARTTFLCLSLLSCASFNDPSQYDLLPAFTALTFSEVTPSTTVDLWELRETTPAGAHRVVATGGLLGRGAVAPALLAQFDATRPSSGFDPTCAPAYCYKYFISLQGSLVTVWTRVEEAHTFLGTIDNRVEAALLAKAHGFYWEDSKETAGIRDIGAGYELVVLALVKICQPVQYDRFLIRVSSTGKLEILRRQVWMRDNACI